MRNISFCLTTPQFLDGSKDVTRRLGWRFLKIGDRLMACEKCQGIKKGGLVRLGVIEVVSVRREELSDMNWEPYGLGEAEREGFPKMSGREFVEMFCEHMKCDPRTWVTRIEFKHLGKEFTRDGHRYCFHCETSLGMTCDPFGRSSCEACFKEVELGQEIAEPVKGGCHV